MKERLPLLCLIWLTTAGVLAQPATGNLDAYRSIVAAALKREDPGVRLTELVRALDRLSDTEFAEMIQPLHAHFARHRHSQDLRTLSIPRWVKLNSRQALTAALALDANVRSRSLTQIARLWYQRAGTEVMAHADSLPRSQRSQFWQHLAPEIAKQDPSAALKLCDQMSAELANVTLPRVLGGWASREPTAATKHVDQLPGGRVRADSIEAVALAWLETDPAATLKWLESIPPVVPPLGTIRLTDESPAQQLLRLRLVVLEAWCEADFESARKALDSRHVAPRNDRPDESSPPSVNLAAYYEIVARHYCQIDLEKALAWINRSGSGRYGAIRGAIDRLAVSVPFEAAKLLKHMHHTTDEDRMVKLVAANWARQDFAAAAEWAQSMSSKKDEAMRIICDYAAQQDLPTARRFYENLPFDISQGIRNRMAQGLASLWAREDAEAAAAWIATHQNKYVKAQALAEIIHNVAAKDPLRALAIMKQHPESREKTDVATVLQFLTRHDPLAAMQWVESQPRFSGSLAQRILQHWPTNRLDEADLVLAKFSDSHARFSAVQVLVRRLQDKYPLAALRLELAHNSGHTIASLPRALAANAEAALEAIESTQLQIQDPNPSVAHHRPTYIRDDAVRILSNIDPQLALKTMKRFETKGRTRDNTIVKALTAMAKDDPIAAISAATQQLSGTSRIDAVRSAILQWAERDFEAALKYARNSPDPSLRSTTIQALARMRAGTNPKAAMDMILTLVPDGQSRIDHFLLIAAEGVFSEWLKADESAALAWLPTKCPPYLRNYLVSTIYRTSNLSPRGLVRLGSSVPAGEVRRSTFGRAMTTWVRTDANEARKFALAAEPADVRNDLLRALLISHSRGAPDHFGALIKEIQDPELRRFGFIYGGRLWLLRKPEEAVEWFRTHREDRETLLNTQNFKLTDFRPQTIMPLVATLPEEQMLRTVEELTLRWMSSDPSVVEWAKSLPDKLGRQHALATASLMLSQRRSRPTSDLISLLKEDPAKGGLYRRLAQKFTYDRRRTNFWVDLLPEGVNRSNAISGAIEASATDRPDLAMRWATTSRSFGLQTNKIRWIVEQSLAHSSRWQNAQPALRASEMIPVQPLRDEMVLRSLTAMTQQRSSEVVRYVEKLPVGDLKRKAFRKFASHWPEKYPVQTINLALALNLVSELSEPVEEAGFALLSAYPSEARTLIPKLPADMQKQLKIKAFAKGKNWID